MFCPFFRASITLDGVFFTGRVSTPLAVNINAKKSFVLLVYYSAVRRLILCSALKVIGMYVKTLSGVCLIAR